MKFALVNWALGIGLWEWVIFPLSPLFPSSPLSPHSPFTPYPQRGPHLPHWCQLKVKTSLEPAFSRLSRFLVKSLRLGMPFIEAPPP
ncbi:hypothetical protein [Nostoc sp.]|uniref:hypothetical protein n=1 Tax=Nostoc sp. TaxID=1180 RepID=UPI002FFC282F